MESSLRPDVFITKMAHVRSWYSSVRLFHDQTYPVCTPEYLEAHPELAHFKNLPAAELLDLPDALVQGRPTLAEVVASSTPAAGRVTFTTAERCIPDATFTDCSAANLTSATASSIATWTSADPVSVEVRIYTIAGRLIQRVESSGVTDARDMSCSVSCSVCDMNNERRKRI